MRLHIVRDEKIINRTIHNFNLVFPNGNKFIVLVDDSSKRKYVEEDSSVCFQKYNTPEFWNYVGNVSSYESIIIHFLTESAIEFVNTISHPNIYWIEWGADLYNYLLKPKGYQLFYNKNILWESSSKRVPSFIYNMILHCRDKKRQNKMLRAVKKVKYFVPDSMYDEYPLIKKYYPELSHLEYRNFYYYPIDEVLNKDLITSYVRGSSIIVGNSGSLTANHELAFNLLSKLNLKGRKVKVPLSYGNPNYIRIVRKQGEQFLGNNFEPISNYMSLDKYNELLLSANIFIYANWRQEAVGNILVALYLGGKVFLDEKNPLLTFYNGIGLTLYSLKELSQDAIDTEIPRELVEKNRKILQEYYSREKQINLIRSNF